MTVETQKNVKLVKSIVQKTQWFTDWERHDFNILGNNSLRTLWLINVTFYIHRSARLNRTNRSKDNFDIAIRAHRHDCTKMKSHKYFEMKAQLYNFHFCRIDESIPLGVDIWQAFQLLFVGFWKSNENKMKSKQKKGKEKRKEIVQFRLFCSLLPFVLIIFPFTETMIFLCCCPIFLTRIFLLFVLVLFVLSFS